MAHSDKGNSGEREFGKTGVWRVFSLTKSNTTESAKRDTRRDSGKEDSEKEQISEKGIGEKRHVRKINPWGENRPNFFLSKSKTKQLGKGIWKREIWRGKGHSRNLFLGQI